MTFDIARFLLLFRRWPAILAIACVVLVDVFDSFGLDQAADEQAARIVGTAGAPFYGGAERQGQSAITVVAIDDASLDHMSWPTPIPYDRQGDIVAAIASYEPAAIFLDFSYTRPHGPNAAEEIGRFAQRLRLLSSNGGPQIMIGEVAEEEIFAPLRELRSVGVAWHDNTWLNYPLHDDAGRPMAASALYAAWCDSAESRCDPWRPEQSETAQRLSLTWGYGGSVRAAEFNGSSADDPCVLPDTRLDTRLAAASREVAGALGRALFSPQGGDAAESRCIYTDTMNAATLLQSPNEAGLEALLAGRIVLVGASHRQSGDLHVIPHVGVVPGVYVHAMAADNLIEWGGAYHRPPPTALLALDWADIVEMLLSASLFVFAWFMLRAIEQARPGESEAARAQRGRLTLLGAIAVGALFVIVAAAIEYALRWPPLNVLGVLVLVTAVASYLQRGQRSQQRELQPAAS